MTRTKNEIYKNLGHLAQEGVSLFQLQDAAERVGATVRVLGNLEKFFRRLPPKELFKIKRGGVCLIIDPSRLTPSFYDDEGGFLSLEIERQKPSYDTALESHIEEAMGFKLVSLQLSEPLVVPEGSPGSKKFLESEAEEISSLIREGGLITREGDSVCACGAENYAGRDVPGGHNFCYNCGCHLQYTGDRHFVKLHEEEVEL